jgi:hypothetical protein
MGWFVKHFDLCGQAVSQLTRFIDLYENDLLWQRSHSGPVTKLDLTEMEKRIMATLHELTAAAVELSTRSDALSVKVDALVTAVDAVVVALENAPLPPDATAALAALKSASANAAAEGDKVDAKVAELDKKLPTPAPAGA